MSADTHTFKSVPLVTDVVDDAVGVEKHYWFVAIVNHNSEKQSSEKLNDLGIENYLPTQTEYRVWNNGRKVKVDRVLIPSTIFIYCTEQRRREIVGLPFINRFMTNTAADLTKDSKHKPLATIPNQQIETLKFMLGQSDMPVHFVDRKFIARDLVRLIRGQLKGLEGIVSTDSCNKTNLIVILDVLGGASVEVSLSDIERI